MPQANTGELRLTVADPIGLGLKSTVELVSEATQYRNTFTTDAAGKVDAERLPFGRYQLEVHAKGFSPVSRLIEVRSALPEKITIQLSLSPVTTTVEVSDQQTLLDPAATGAVERIGAQTIETRETSLPGRSLVDLVNSQPGWLFEGNGVLHPRGEEYQTQFVVDGIPLTDRRAPGLAPEGFSAGAAWDLGYVGWKLWHRDRLRFAPVRLGQEHVRGQLRWRYDGPLFEPAGARELYEQGDDRQLRAAIPQPKK